jgi:SAM-dependent methyltransferase
MQATDWDRDQIRNGSLRCESCGKSTQIKDCIWRAMGPGKRQPSIAQITNVWPNALFYESLWRPGALSRFSGRKFPLSEELGEMAAAVRPGPGKVYVDIACSEGLYARTLAASGSPVLAIEHSVPMLKKVVMRARRAGVPVVAVQAVAQRLPIADGAMAGAVIGGSFNEIGDRAGAVAEMHRVIQPGGRAFSMHLSSGRTAAGRLLQGALKPNGIVFDTAEGWIRDLTATGLRVETDHRDRIVQRLTLRA